ncbi:MULTISPECIES: hypothetical protein [Bacillus]|uniref:Regulatory protein n=2 Tax=Bacillus TaxID=1386 RepID=A0A0M3R9F9_9BACI|nr:MULTISPECIES: hypothetical protein [Bacillus]ALC81356.1 hypothetical protein AM592_06915 [Bacillus gobiensis]MBP1080373.1 putative double-glycine peptidase [Bacillus capparidis]MED1094235.1 hypothetical protein [Bacillus capparidis]
MEEKELKKILNNTFTEIYKDIEKIVEIAKFSKPSLEKEMEEAEQRLKQNIVAIEIHLKTKP